MGNKRTHVIENYNVALNTILCVCGVTVTADNPDGTMHHEWVEHKRWGEKHPFNAPKQETGWKSMSIRRLQMLDSAEEV